MRNTNTKSRAKPTARAADIAGAKSKVAIRAGVYKPVLYKPPIPGTSVATVKAGSQFAAVNGEMVEALANPARLDNPIYIPVTVTDPAPTRTTILNYPAVPAVGQIRRHSGPQDGFQLFIPPDAPAKIKRTAAVFHKFGRVELARAGGLSTGAVLGVFQGRIRPGGKVLRALHHVTGGLVGLDEAEFFFVWIRQKRRDWLDAEAEAKARSIKTTKRKFGAGKAGKGKVE